MYRTNCYIAVTSEKCHSGENFEGFGKVSSTVNRTAINKRFVINMMLFITVLILDVLIGDLPICLDKYFR